MIYLKLYITPYKYKFNILPINFQYTLIHNFFSKPNEEITSQNPKPMLMPNINKLYAKIRFMSNKSPTIYIHPKIYMYEDIFH